MSNLIATLDAPKRRKIRTFHSQLVCLNLKRSDDCSCTSFMVMQERAKLEETVTVETVLVVIECAYVVMEKSKSSKEGKLLDGI